MKYVFKNITFITSYFIVYLDIKHINFEYLPTIVRLSQQACWNGYRIGK